MSVSASCFEERLTASVPGDSWMRDQNYHLAWFPVVVATFVLGRLMCALKDRTFGGKSTVLVMMALVFTAGLAFCFALAVRGMIITMALWTSFLDCTSELGGLHWWMGWTTASLVAIPACMVALMFAASGLDPWRARLLATALVQTAAPSQAPMAAAVSELQPVPTDPPAQPGPSGNSHPPLSSLVDAPHATVATDAPEDPDDPEAAHLVTLGFSGRLQTLAPDQTQP